MYPYKYLRRDKQLFKPQGKLKGVGATKQSKHEDNPDWDFTLSDVGKFKLTPEQLERRRQERKPKLPRHLGSGASKAVGHTVATGENENSQDSDSQDSDMEDDIPVLDSLDFGAVANSLKDNSRAAMLSVPRSASAHSLTTKGLGATFTLDELDKPLLQHQLRPSSISPDRADDAENVSPNRQVAHTEWSASPAAKPAKQDADKYSVDIITTRTATQPITAVKQQPLPSVAADMPKDTAEVMQSSNADNANTSALKAEVARLSGQVADLQGTVSQMQREHAAFSDHTTSLISRLQAQLHQLITLSAAPISVPPFHTTSHSHQPVTHLDHDEQPAPGIAATAVPARQPQHTTGSRGDGNQPSASAAAIPTWQALLAGESSRSDAPRPSAAAPSWQATAAGSSSHTNHTQPHAFTSTPAWHALPASGNRFDQQLPHTSTAVEPQSHGSIMDREEALSGGPWLPAAAAAAREPLQPLPRPATAAAPRPYSPMFTAAGSGQARQAQPQFTPPWVEQPSSPVSTGQQPPAGSRWPGLSSPAADPFQDDFELPSYSAVRRSAAIVTSSAGPSSPYPTFMQAQASSGSAAPPAYAAFTPGAPAPQQTFMRLAQQGAHGAAAEQTSGTAAVGMQSFVAGMQGSGVSGGSTMRGQGLAGTQGPPIGGQGSLAAGQALRRLQVGPDSMAVTASPPRRAPPPPLPIQRKPAGEPSVHLGNTVSQQAYMSAAAPSHHRIKNAACQGLDGAHVP